MIVCSRPMSFVPSGRSWLMAKTSNFMSIAKSWLNKKGLHGPHAFLRFVMLVFVQRLNEGRNEFIFKGGNLLWLYINTPRSTIDADFVTRSINSHEEVRKHLEEVCGNNNEQIQFSIWSFIPIEKKNGRGAAVTIRYLTKEGQSNSFALDIVYAVTSAVTTMDSPIDSLSKINVVTIENIISDKLSACQKFKGGNTRMKDYDDLWRISRFEDIDID
ncbi:MAG: hypothetical protein EOP48_22995, partial [Sphingobacteriales bacterium]